MNIYTKNKKSQTTFDSGSVRHVSEFCAKPRGQGQKKPCDVSFTPSFCLRDSLPTDPVKNKAERASFTFGTHLSGLLRSAINTQSRPYGHLRVLLLRRQALSCVLHLAYLIFDSGIVAHFLALCNSFLRKIAYNKEI